MKIPVLQPDGSITEQDIDITKLDAKNQVECYCIEHFMARCEEIQKILFDLVRCGETVMLAPKSLLPDNNKCRAKDCDLPTEFVYVRLQR